MVILYGIFMWVNAWCADRAFRRREYIWGTLCAVMSATCFMMWLVGVTS